MTGLANKRAVLVGEAVDNGTSLTDSEVCLIPIAPRSAMMNYQVSLISKAPRPSVVDDETFAIKKVLPDDSPLPEI